MTNKSYMRFSLRDTIVEGPYHNCPLGVPVLCAEDNNNRITTTVANIQLLIRINCKDNSILRLRCKKDRIQISGEATLDDFCGTIRFLYDYRG